MVLDTLQFVFQYFITIAVAISPLAVVALFVSMTSFYTPKERIQTARMGCLVAFVVIEFFAIFGRKIFELFGISIGSFYVAGGLLIFLVGLDMLRAQDSDVHITEGEVKELKNSAKQKNDISITPFGIPIVAGPCLITNAIAQQMKASNWMESVGGFITLALVIVALYFLLILSARGAKWLTPTILKLSYRLSGLILAALAIEMIVSGIKSKDLGLFPERPQVAQVVSLATISAEQSMAS
ncbi:MAG: MarC family protein [Puniceicoccales bacterium]|jgi:multiple antibiotic resistance protein|nr:MarC family protein [Puniceicoccales bacterium]